MNDDKRGLPQEDIVKRTRAPRKATLSKKIKDEDSETEGDYEVSAETPKSKPGRRIGATTVSANDQVVDTISTSNAKDDPNENGEDNETPVEDAKTKPGRKGRAPKEANALETTSKAKKRSKRNTTIEVSSQIALPKTNLTDLSTIA